MPFARPRTTAILLSSVACLALLPTLSPSTGRAEQTDQPVPPAVTPGVRTITVAAVGSVTFPADTFSVFIDVRSGVAKPAQVTQQIEAEASRLQDVLARASLPAAEPTTDDPPSLTPASDSNVYGTRRYVVHVESLDAGRKVEAALIPVVDMSNTVSSTPAIANAAMSASNAQLRRDPTAGHAQARRKALENARDEASQSADALGMKLGMPLVVSKLSVQSGVSDETTTLSARGEVVFELLPK